MDLLTRSNRRGFLRIAFGSACAWTLFRAKGALGLGEASKFFWVQVAYNGGWNPRPTGGRGLLLEVGKRTSVDVALESRRIRLTDPHVRNYPFLCISGAGDFPPLSREEGQALRSHLTSGGMLFADDASGEDNGRFARELKSALSVIFPDKEWRRLPSDHSVLRSFYLLDRVVGRTASSAFLEGLDHEDRTPVILSRNDLLGACARDEFGAWEYQVIPGGESQRETAFRLGINIVLYALTVNYKKDQIHQPFILQRKR